MYVHVHKRSDEIGAIGRITWQLVELRIKSEYQIEHLRITQKLQVADVCKKLEAPINGRNEEEVQTIPQKSRETYSQGHIMEIWKEDKQISRTLSVCSR